MVSMYLGHGPSQGDFGQCLSAWCSRWEALSWPYRIYNTVEKTLTVLLEDEERFAKLQAADTIAMEERLSAIAVSDYNNNIIIIIIVIIIIIKRISRAPIYHTRWHHRALYNNTD